MSLTGTIALVGSGTMGEAIIKAILDKGLVSPRQVTAADIRPERGRELAKRYGIHTTTDNVIAVREADIVVLAVKPQVLASVLSDLQGHIRAGALVISIVAGAQIETLTKGLGHQAVIRSMPNTPAQIGVGMTVWTATPAVTAGQKAQAEEILRAMGEAIYVHEEKYLDMATAVSGSGPAYFFLILEAMVDAAVRLGFARPVARQLVIQTALGSVLFARASDKHLAELRNMVTSPGGTTAEALHEMEKGALRAVINEAIAAAHARSRSLARSSE